jgi:transposase
MAGAAPLALDAHETEILRKTLRSHTLGKHVLTRVQIVLAAVEGLPNLQIQKLYGIEEHRVATWRNRFHTAHELWKNLDPTHRPKMNEKLLLSWLSDKKGRGRKATITLEQRALIIAVACEPPSKSGYPHTHWTDRLLAQEVIKRGIVDYIAFQTVWSFLKGSRPATAQKPLLSEGERERNQARTI